MNAVQIIIIVIVAIAIIIAEINIWCNPYEDIVTLYGWLTVIISVLACIVLIIIGILTGNPITLIFIPIGIYTFIKASCLAL